ncbi:D-alanyl-D-alanine carboxypeptidase DacA precursor [bacterium BMS3Bbin10]|nr:D-alanyl-D-alanine carboxypeptidase DacA precursor [bacterium BMS3Bbin10]
MGSRGHRKSFVAFLALVLCVVFAGGALAKPKSKDKFQTKAKWAVLMDADTNTVLFAKNSDERMPPASMSKLMTMAVIFQALKEGRISLEDEFSNSLYAWRTGGAPSGGSAMFVPLKGSATLGELLQGIAVQSGNDASIIVAEGMSGSEDAFAEVMNEYARKIGLTESNFRNSTGLPDPDHYMTALELAKLAIHVIKEYPEYYHYFSQKEYRYRKHIFYNRNPLVYDGIGVDGLKTGYIRAAGYGLVASSKQRGQRLVVVVNGLKSKKARRAEGKRLLQWGFRSFRQWKLFDAGETIGDALVWGGTKRHVSLTGKGRVSIFLPRTASRKIKAAIVYEGPLKPPIKKGDQVAFLRVTAPDATVNNIPLYAGEDVGEGSLWKKGMESAFHLAFGWLL